MNENLEDYDFEIKCSDVIYYKLLKIMDRLSQLPFYKP